MVIKKILKIFFAIFIVLLSGCPDFKQNEPVTGIKIYNSGVEQENINIETGQIITLKAVTAASSIIWEINESGLEFVEIADTGEGSECLIKGKKEGYAELTVRAWRLNEKPAEKHCEITITKARVTDILFSGSLVIGNGEKRVLSGIVFPSWAQYKVTWEIKSDPENVLELSNDSSEFSAEGKKDGKAVITAKAGLYERDFEITVKTPDTLSALNIYSGGVNISGNNIDIGVFEEKFLLAKTEPSSAYTFFKWESDSADVSVDSNGMIKGITADGSAVITVYSGNLQASVTVKVGNPVAGIRVRYDNTDSLVVSNIIWMYPGDRVKLKAQLIPEGIDGEITWSGGEGAVELSNSGGENCTITGYMADDFETPAVIVRVSAANHSNGTRPADVFLRIKVLEKEALWAWDRARDADLNTELKNFSGNYEGGIYTPGIPYGNNPREGGEEWKIGGRGKYASQMQNIINGNPIPYTPFGLNINSSGDTTPAPPFPAPEPANSTRIMFGSNKNEETSPVNAVPGIFNFVEPKTPIRISIDYEIISSNGRAIWITVNNNRPTHGQSVLGNTSRLLQKALEPAKGTKVTEVQVMDVPDLERFGIPGFKSLEQAFVGIIVLSRGGNIYVSGIRIEEGE